MANSLLTLFQEKLKRSPRDEQTAKKVHEHLVNVEDKITDEDIRNVKTDFADENVNEITEVPGEKETEALAKNEENPDDKGIKDNTDPGIESAWNILEP